MADGNGVVRVNEGNPCYHHDSMMMMMMIRVCACVCVCVCVSINIYIYIYIYMKMYNHEKTQGFQRMIWFIVWIICYHEVFRFLNLHQVVWIFKWIVKTRKFLIFYFCWWRSLSNLCNAIWVRKNTHILSIYLSIYLILFISF